MGMTLPVTYSFFFNDTTTTEIYTLSLHDALPIATPTTTRGRCCSPPQPRARQVHAGTVRHTSGHVAAGDRKSTRLNSSHANISYAVFCLKKTNNITKLRSRSSLAHTLQLLIYYDL